MKRFVFGAAVQGASHVRNGKECQDSLRKVEKDPDTVILAVADGHGSEACPYSRTGSDIAVKVFCRLMSNYLDRYAGQPETLMTFFKREGDTKVAQEIDAEWKRRVWKRHCAGRREIPTDEQGEKDKNAVYTMYGSTLIGLVITGTFLFAFQLGDGDIMEVTEHGVHNVIAADKILGTETHSLSRNESWKKAVTCIKRQSEPKLPVMYMLSSDGMSNSYKSEEEFHKTCRGYYELLREHGARAVSRHLKEWLRETSELGCGDDITALFAYLTDGAKE